MKRLNAIGLLLTVLLFASCNDGGSTSFSPDPVIRACERNQTATLTVDNRGHTTVRILINGSGKGYLRVGEEATYTVPSRITHTIDFRFVDGHRCSQARFVISTCSGKIMWCAHF